MSNQNCDNNQPDQDYLGHRERLRQKFAACPEAMLDYEFVELLLTFAVPRGDVKPIAKQLLKKYHNSFHELYNTDWKYNDSAEEEKEKRVKGFGKNSALLFEVIKEANRRQLCEKKKLKTIADTPEKFSDEYKKFCFNFNEKYTAEVQENVKNNALAELHDETHEKLVAFFLNSKLECIGKEIIAQGNPNSVHCSNYAIVKAAVRHAATAVALCHNHPSGTLSPSKEDDMTTQSVKKALELVEIKLLDHIIVSPDDDFYSYRANIEKKPHYENYLSEL